MAQIIIPSRWTRQPQGPVQIDWGESITRGLVSYVLASAREYDLAQNGPTSFAGAAAGTDLLQPKGNGEAFRVAYDTSAGWDAPLQKVVALNDVSHSIFARYYSRITSTSEQRLIGAGNAPSSAIVRYWITTGSTTGGAYAAGFGVSGSTSGYSLVNSVLETGKIVDLASSWINGTDLWPRPFINGVPTTPSSTTDLVSIATTSLTAVRYMNDSGGRYPRGGLSVGAYWQRALSDAEQKALSENPYFFLRPISNRKIFVGLAAPQAQEAAAAQAQGVSAAVSAALVAYSPYQRQVPGGPFAVEASEAQRQVPGGPMLHELPSAPAPDTVPVLVEAGAFSEFMSALVASVASAMDGGLSSDFSALFGRFGRPVADVSNTGWGSWGSNYLYDAVDEAVRSDADYVYTTAAASARLSLTQHADPGDTAHAVFLASPAGYTPVGTLIVRLYSADLQVASWQIDDLAADEVRRLDLTDGQRDSITDYQDLELELEVP